MKLHALYAEHTVLWVEICQITCQQLALHIHSTVVCVNASSSNGTFQFAHQMWGIAQNA